MPDELIVSGDCIKVELQVPEHIDFQLVYRMKRQEPFACSWPEPFRFVFVKSFMQGLKLWRVMAKAWGPLLAAKALAKLATPSRCLYLVLSGDRVVSDGWCTSDRCKVYKLEPGSVVIGPIWSDPEIRGQGLATRALQAAINEYVRRNVKIFYIDTAKCNIPAQRVFDKCGFGEPVALYFR